MYWPRAHSCIDTLSAELLFQYHKLEKGLVMPEPRRMFGVAPAKKTMKLLAEWEFLSTKANQDPIFLAGIGALQSFQKHIKALELDKNDLISTELCHFLAQYSDQTSLFPTPTKKNDYFNPVDFKSLSVARRSVRSFQDKVVPKQILIDSFESAQLAPSACNRQPCSVKIVNDANLKAELLKYQNGNHGFGHLAPTVAIILADSKYFFGVIERHQPFIDGGLFSMSFLLALQSHGVSSCCLNWCVTPENDRKVHDLLGIEKSQRIIMYMAIGYAPENIEVATSTRRLSSQKLDFIDDNSSSNL